MGSAEEWTEYKFTQLGRLRSLTFRLRRYEAPTPDWDHDHCYGCLAKFSEFDGDDIQHEGYFTTVPAQESSHADVAGLTCVGEPTPGGLAFRWVCRECFEEFREALGFAVDP